MKKKLEYILFFNPLSLYFFSLSKTSLNPANGKNSLYNRCKLAMQSLIFVTL